MKTLANKSFQELRNLAITQVYCNDILSFGFTLNDGSVCRDEPGNYNFFHTFDPALKITSIEHIFFKDEFRILQMNFYSGDELLVKVGWDDQTLENDGGRKETFDIADDEQLIGCELGCNDFYFLSVRWLAMKVPKRIMEEILVQEMEALKIREQ